MRIDMKLVLPFNSLDICAGIVGSDLGDLRVGVRPGIPGEGNELVDQPQLNAPGHRMREHTCPSKN